jgi:hypothetical protein
VWVLGDGGLARVAPDGRVQPSLTRRAAGGPLGDEDHLAVSPDGTLWLLGAEGRMRVLGPDGEVRFVSPRSQRADAAPASGE